MRRDAPIVTFEKLKGIFSYFFEIREAVFTARETGG